MSAQGASRVTLVAGRGIPIVGDDIDTDRIMPARFLKVVSFDGLEAHVFADERAAATSRGDVHPFDDGRYEGATVLVVGRNFGCGSSREHAPQGIARWGIRAVVGVSFAEIFFSNATALGIACVSIAPGAVRELEQMLERSPQTVVTVDLMAEQVCGGGSQWPLSMPASAREALMAGSWDATAMLTADFDAVRATAARLPYINGF